MPQVVTGRFTEVKFTQEELALAKTFPEINLLYLCSLRSLVATQILALVYDPTKPHLFLGDHAALVGKLNILDEIIGD